MGREELSIDDIVPRREKTMLVAIELTSTDFFPNVINALEDNRHVVRVKVLKKENVQVLK